MIDAKRSILARRARGEAELNPAERGENLAIFGAAFDVYRACWPDPVRHYFQDLTDATYAVFDLALTVLGEALYEGAERPDTVVSLITPQAFTGELVR